MKFQGYLFLFKPYIQSNCTCGIIAQKFNPVVELVIPVEKLTKEAIA